MILVIDNYDSFTYNLVQLLAVQGAPYVVRRNDEITPDDAAALAPAGIIISPGPGTPDRAGHALAVVRRMGASCPILGVCLGHQIIAEACGARVDRAPAPVHGMTSRITHDACGVFTNVPVPFEAARYHSLVVIETSLPDTLVVSARSDDGLIMGLRHRTLPLEGVQFHPESILTAEGATIMRNFLRLARHPTASWAAQQTRATSARSAAPAAEAHVAEAAS